MKGMKEEKEWEWVMEGEWECRNVVWRSRKGVKGVKGDEKRMRGGIEALL